MAEYNFREVEKKWRTFWKANGIYKTGNDLSKPKYYVLDMFPYPSGSGLHVGHPLGYIASDIVSRYKKMKGFNVLHPMGFDSFGLPAEQYAINTGQHPAITTENNIARYKEQLKNLGFSFDWDREVRTSDPSFYKWTQWIFRELYNSWYNKTTDKAEDIDSLVHSFEKEGNKNIAAACNEDTPIFSASEWKQMTEREKQVLLLKYRLAYVNESHVNWCPALGTVLSNDEVKDGFSERGGHPVIKKKMPQWSMRITAYAERLLRGLETIEWPEPIKEMQRNWIGKSVGAELDFSVAEKNMQIRVFTTRLDTIYGVTFLTLAPESDIVSAITTEVQRPLVEAYIQQAIHKSEKDRMSDVKSVSGVFTGSYALHPFTKESIPIWVADYVLSGYGTGVVMGVPCSDTRDYAFAKHFSLPIIPVLEGETADITKSNFIAKSGKMIHSQDLNGMEWDKALVKITAQIEQMHIGKQKINYKMRDAIFGRQRYWGEPIPIYYKDGIPYVLDNTALPLTLPEVNAYLPTEYGEPPLARAMDFKTQDGNPYEYTTMPGWAGSSWYFFRYMDPHNEKEFCSKEAQRYWQKVDLYLGGAEHATGHLLYSRFWTKFLYDKGFVNVDEYAQKLVNQGMIQGRSNFVYRVVGENTFVSFHLIQNYKTTPLHVDVNMVENDVLDIEKFKNARAEAKTAQFILEDDKYICGWEVEKMSKSKLNVVNPDDIIEKYGADTLRLYEMFLGPLEQFKPWNTNGIEGVHKFLKKLWKFFVDENSNGRISLEKPNPEELKILHKTIKKASEDIERLSFNTSVSAFMICLNELIALKCNKKEILEPFILLIAPYTPHIAEELWYLLGNKSSVTVAPYPLYNPEYVQEDSFEYPIAINGKTRTKILFSLDIEATAIEKQVIENESVLKWTDGKKIKKIIIMKGKIINIVTD